MPEQPVTQPSGATGAPAGGDQTPSNQTGQTQSATAPAPDTTVTQPQTTTTPVTTAPVPVSVQERIDRMYARLQKEREARIRAEQTAVATRAITRPVQDEEEDEEETGEVTQTQPVGVSAADVEAILSRKELEKRFQASETNVLQRHPTALKDDGTFNLEDQFVKEYIDVGRRNPYLAFMENGPELAEAFVNQKLGIDYKKGRVDEANRTTNITNATTLTSTTSIPAATTTTLTASEQAVARKMGLTDAEYTANKGRQPVSKIKK